MTVRTTSSSFTGVPPEFLSEHQFAHLVVDRDIVQAGKAGTEAGPKEFRADLPLVGRGPQPLFGSRLAEPFELVLPAPTLSFIHEGEGIIPEGGYSTSRMQASSPFGVQRSAPSALTNMKRPEKAG